MNYFYFNTPNCPPIVYLNLSYHHNSLFPLSQFSSAMGYNQPIPPNYFPLTNQANTNTVIEQEVNQGTIRQSTHRKRQKNAEKERTSAKKNSQSNIINHYFIFFTTKQCSKQVVTRLAASLKSQKASVQLISSLFWSLMKIINIKRGKSYMNRQILMKYFSEEGLKQKLPETIQQIQKLGFIMIKDLASLLRKSIFWFLREAALQSTLTSKRITTISKSIHLQRRNKMISQMHLHLK